MVYAPSHAEKKIVIYILNNQYVLEPTKRTKMHTFKQIPNDVFESTKAKDEVLGKTVRAAFEHCETE
jgi:hypothetical protein